MMKTYTICLGASKIAKTLARTALAAGVAFLRGGLTSCRRFRDWSRGPDEVVIMNASRSSRAVTKELFFCAEPAVVGFADVTGGFVGFSVVTPVAGGVRHGFQHRFAPDIIGASLILGPTSQRLVSAAPHLVLLRGQSNRSLFAAFCQFVRATACQVV